MRSGNNTVESFLIHLVEEGRLDAPESKRSKELYRLFTEWCKDTGRRGMNDRSFKAEMLLLGHQYKRRGDGRYYVIDRVEMTLDYEDEESDG